jgi:hypothetical protein
MLNSRDIMFSRGMTFSLSTYTRFGNSTSRNIGYAEVFIITFGLSKLLR